jgi:DNA topoisomerase-6 subunit A
VSVIEGIDGGGGGSGDGTLFGGMGGDDAPKKRGKKGAKGKKPLGDGPAPDGGDGPSSPKPAGGDDAPVQRGSGEASFAIRERAFKADVVVEAPDLPADEGLPPGVDPEKHKKTLKAKEAALKKGGGAKKELKTLGCIEKAADGVYKTILAGEKPELQSPVRALSNVKYEKKTGYFELGRQKKVRTLTVNTVKTFAQTLQMMSLSKEMIVDDTFATKRDAYYQSKNWEEARFDEQPESDAVMDDIEAMFSVDGVTREELRFYPEEHGGAVAGELVVIDRDPVTGGKIRIDCTKFGTGSYAIPHSVEQLQFETKAKFILAIETGGMFQRLQHHAYPTKTNCLIISMGGVPTRACRRFIRRLSEEKGLPVYAFTDCDPYGFANIYRSLKVGSGNAAHINRFFCVPEARMLGVTPDDIVKYKLEKATHPLKDVDIQRAKDALKNDPFFKSSKPWTRAIEQMLEMGVRAEQQALSKWGLNYVIDTYLPEKLKRPQDFLP